jgi:hypothetical protein
MRFKIVCPVCRKQKSGDTRHGFKLFGLMHGIRCDAKVFNQTEQFTISDFTGGDDDSED